MGGDSDAVAAGEDLPGRVHSTNGDAPSPEAQSSRAQQFRDDLRATEELAKTVQQIVGGQTTLQVERIASAYAEFLDGWGGAHLDTEMLRESMFQVRAKLFDLRIILQAVHDLSETNEKFDSQLVHVLSEIGDAGVAFRRTVKGLKFGDVSARRAAIYLNNALGEKLGALELLLDATKARDQTREILQDTRQAAGEVGALSLGIHFQEYATRESRIADRLRAAALLVVAVLTLATAVFLFGGAPTTVGMQELVRLSIAVPLIALAGYLGREASRHRRIANWARQREVQLKTLDAFVAPMSDEDKQKLRLQLGGRVFGVDLPDLTAKEDSPSVTLEAADAVRSIAVDGRARASKKKRGRATR